MKFEEICKMLTYFGYRQDHVDKVFRNPDRKATAAISSYSMLLNTGNGHHISSTYENLSIALVLILFDEFGISHERFIYESIEEIDERMYEWYDDMLEEINN